MFRVSTDRSASLSSIRSAILATTVSACLLVPSPALAECRDTFNTAFVPAGAPPGPGDGTPYQHLFPLGVGASLNALVSTMNTVNTAFLSPSSSFVSAKGDAEPGYLGGGVWARAAAGWVDSKSTTTGKVDTSQARATDFSGNPTQVSPVTGTGTCLGSLSERYYGYQFGFDLAKLNIGGAGGNFHFGLTAGYFESRAKDESESSLETRTFGGGSPLTLFSPSGSFQSDVSVPFVGLYAAYTQGNFFIDGQVRQDFYLMNFTDPENGLSSQSQNAYGTSVGGNVGYRVPLAAKWFVEPSAGVMWSLVKVDTISTQGSALFQNLNAGTVNVDDIQSLLGRVSVRIGTTFASNELVWQPFITGSVFHEFADDATATSKIGGPVNSATSCGGLPGCPSSGFYLNSYRNQILNTSTSRIGTYSQIGIGTATVFGNTGWLAYGRADYKTGENVEGFNFNAGLRYHW